MARFKIPPPTSGGLLLSYKCQARCRHCIYACSPEWKADLDLEQRNLFHKEGLSLNINVQYVDDTYQYYANYAPWPATGVTTDKKNLDDYTLVDLRLTQAFKAGEIFMAADNIFNEDYANQFGVSITDRDFPMPGRNVRLGIKMKF